MNATSVGAFDAKTRFSELLRRVQEGEEFEITHRGRVVARLGPPGEGAGKESLKATIALVREGRVAYGLRPGEAAAWRKEGRKEG